MIQAPGWYNKLSNRDIQSMLCLVFDEFSIMPELTFHALFMFMFSAEVKSFIAQAQYLVNVRFQ